MAGTPEGPELDGGLSGLDDLIEKAFEEPEPSDEGDDDDATEDIVTTQPEGDEEEDVEDDDDEDLEGEEDEEEDEDEDADEEDEDEDEEEEDEDEEEEVLSVTASELKLIKADPALSKLHSSMVRDYTKKTSVLAERTREVESGERMVREFTTAVRTEQGMADYLAETLTSHPRVVGAAFEAAASGDKAKDFLVAIGDAHPEIFEAAYERLQEISEDEDERKRYHKDRDFQSKEANLKEREDRIRRTTFDREFAALLGAAEKEARRLGIEDEDLKTVQDRLKEKIRGQVREDGSIILRSQDAKAVAKSAKGEMDRQYEKAVRALNRKKAKESRETTKRKARGAKAKKRVPPKGVRRKTPRDKKKKFVPEEGRDPLDSFIDERLST